MPQSLAKNLIHLVFSTKDRMPTIQDTVRDELHAYITMVLNNQNCNVIVLNSVEDHIHILFNLHRTKALSEVVKELKQSSSKMMKRSASGFTWQAGYGAFSVSESKKQLVVSYIKKQKEHHQKLSYQDELRELLEKHAVEYNEEYLWD